MLLLAKHDTLELVKGVNYTGVKQNSQHASSNSKNWEMKCSSGEITGRFTQQ